MKVAIFGGAFNPVHIEHVNIVKSAIDFFGFDKIIIMPTAQSPHKSGALAASGEDRAKMCALAFADIPQVEVSDFELSQGGVSYSYITCGRFKEKYPTADRYFIMGADMLKSFPQWKNPERILACVKVAACAREDEKAVVSYAKAVEERFSVKVSLFSYVGARVSSTRIRTLAALGEEISEYVLPQVGQYIKSNALYFQKNLQRVKDLLTVQRWEHTVRVAIMCAENAPRIGMDEKTAITMGALHDCAKYMKVGEGELEDFTAPKDVPPPVVHQYSGAYIAKKLFGVTDEKILSAIACHTSGKKNMSPSDALLFLCDLLEEGRDFDGVEELRSIFYRDIDECLYIALRRQVKYLSEQGKPVYSLTEKAYEYLKRRYEQ